MAELVDTSHNGRFTSCDPLMFNGEHIADPQRWNLYAYVENDPLALSDPDGRDGVGQDGKKTITVFLNYAEYELDAGELKVDHTGKKEWIKQETLPKPDWSALQKLAGKYGYNLAVHARPSGVLANSAWDFEKAAAESELVGVAGHAVLDASGTVVGILLSEYGLIEPPGSNYSDFTTRNSDKVTFSGKFLVNFACNTDQLAIETLIRPTRPDAQYVSIKDGDGKHSSSIPTNNWALYRYVEAYMKSGGDPVIAAAAARKVYKESKLTFRGLMVDRLDTITSRTIMHERR